MATDPDRQKSHPGAARMASEGNRIASGLALIPPAEHARETKREEAGAEHDHRGAAVGDVSTGSNRQAHLRIIIMAIGTEPPSWQPRRAIISKEKVAQDIQ